MPRDDRSAAILKVMESPQGHSQRHLRLGGSRADDRVEFFLDAIQPSKRDTQTDVTLEVGQRALVPVEEDTQRGGLVLSEALRVLAPSTVVPDQSLMRESPALVVLAEKVDEGVSVQSGVLCPDPEHHTRTEDPL